MSPLSRESSFYLAVNQSIHNDDTFLRIAGIYLTTISQDHLKLVAEYSHLCKFL